MRVIWLFVLVCALLFIGGCSNGKQQVATVLKENPDIIFDAIKEHPLEFVEVLQLAMDAAKQELARQAQQSEEENVKQLIEKHLSEPLQPVIRDDEAIRGNKTAPLVLVEYSDFECPFCSRGQGVVAELMKRYGDQLQFVYKHLPLSFHQHAMKAASYYEALRLQDPAKAFAFHDELFANQGELQKGDSFLQATAKKVGADMKRLKADLGSDKIKKRISDDIEEAAKFGFNGTPAFILNGVPVLGAYPVEHFEMIIGKLKEHGTVALAEQSDKPLETQ